MNQDVARLLYGSQGATSHDTASNSGAPLSHALGSKRSMKMLVQAQRGGGQAPALTARPVHRTASWPPAAPPDFTEEAPSRGRASPLSDLGPPSASSSSSRDRARPLATRERDLPESGAACLQQPALRAPDSTDLDRIWGPGSREPARAEAMSPIARLTSSLLRRPREADEPALPEAAPEPTSSPPAAQASTCCYSIPSSGNVTAVVVTDQLDYLFVAFSSGAIRVFHLASGSADPEDRFGYVLCYLGSYNSASSMGKLAVHLEIGGGGQAAGCTSRHLFAAAKSGATRMYIVDLDSLRESQRSRGFITTSGGHIKLFSKSDSRLRGFTSLTTMEYTADARGCDAAGLPYYRARYRLVCGKGFGSFTVWEVVLCYLPGPSSADEGCYTDTWEVLGAASVGSPALQFGCFSRQQPGALVEVLIHGVEKTFLKSFSFSAGGVVAAEGSEAPAGAMTAGRSIKPPCNNGLPCRVLCASNDGCWIFGGLEELIVYRYDVTPAGPGPVLAAEMHYSLLSGDSAGGHGRHLRQVEHVWCTGDGRYAVVLCSDNAVLLYTQGPNAFDAHQGPRSATAVKGGSVLDGWKGSLSVWFQANDQFTLQFGLCYKPTEAPPAQTTSPSRSVVESLEGDGGRLPTDVMVSVAWMPSWKNTDKSRGVLRFERLADASATRPGCYQPAFLLPKDVVVDSIGLNQTLRAHNRIERRSSLCCAVCGDRVQHWTAATVARGDRAGDSESVAASDSESDDETECAEVDEDDAPLANVTKKRPRSNDVVKGVASSKNSAGAKPLAGKKKKTGQLSVESSASSGNLVSSIMSEYTADGNEAKKPTKVGRRPIQRHAPADSLTSMGDGKAPGSPGEGSGSSTAQARRIAQLETRLEASRQGTIAARQELDMVVRKGDRRFKEEMRLRKEWNAKQAKWELDKAELTAQLREYRESGELFRSECLSALAGMTAMSDRLRGALQAAPAGGGGSASSTIDNANRSALVQSPGQLLRGNPRLFCVVCQSNTAEMVFSECGHMCLCLEHYTLMNDAEAERGGLKNCPLCKKYNSSVVRVRGLY